MARCRRRPRLRLRVGVRVVLVRGAHRGRRGSARGMWPLSLSSTGCLGESCGARAQSSTGDICEQASGTVVSSTSIPVRRRRARRTSGAMCAQGQSHFSTALARQIRYLYIDHSPFPTSICRLGEYAGTYFRTGGGSGGGVGHVDGDLMRTLLLSA